MIEKTSTLDRIYRRLLLSKFFTRGWGSPTTIKRQFDFLRVLANRESCEKLVDETYPVNVDSDVQKGDVRILDGHFRSPFDLYLPNVMPKEARTARFQLIVPTRWPTHRKPVCVHMAGTGDHFFWRRRTFLARPLIKEYGIGSLLLENPFYGQRKPKDQLRSSLRHVNELFVMGGGLILEGLVMLHWCEKHGFGPLGLTGISMGGHMASLTATNWHKPIPLIPCLSWSSATPVFTEGVMSGSIPWPILVTQYMGHHLEYEKEIMRKLHKCPKTDAFTLGQEFAWNYPESIDSLKRMHQQSSPSQDQNPTAPSTSESTSKTPSQPSIPQAPPPPASVPGSTNMGDRETPSEITSTHPVASSDNKNMASHDGGRASLDSCENLDVESSAIELGHLGKMSLYETVVRSCREFTFEFGSVSMRSKKKETISTKDAGVRLCKHDSTACSCEQQSTSHGKVVESAHDELPDSNTKEIKKTLKLAFIRRGSKGSVINSTIKGPSPTGDSERTYKEEATSKSSGSESKRKTKSAKRESETGIENYQALKNEALEFMRGVMDVTTFVGNFSTPVDPSLVIVVTALRDGYVPRKGVPGLDDIWPDVEVRYIDCGHISAFLFKQTEFRKAINDSFNKYFAKYEDDHKKPREVGSKGKS